MRLGFHITAALLLLASPALAEGQAGLWTVTTNWQFSPPVVPRALVSMAREQDIAPPRNGQPFLHHICMTDYEARGRDPLHLNNRDYDCEPRIVSARRGVTVMDNVCHGQVEGVGRTRITWRGNSHFEGTYSFIGKFRGDPARISSSFSAEWAGRDCRGIRVFIPQQP
jgi:hypothetical protein